MALVLGTVAAAMHARAGDFDVLPTVAEDVLLAAGWHGRSDLYATFIRALDAQS